MTSSDLHGAGLAQVNTTVRNGSARLRCSPRTVADLRARWHSGGRTSPSGRWTSWTQAHLTAGRLPASCSPARCEVLAVRAPGAGSGLDLAAATAAARGLGLIITGTAELSDERLIGVGLVNGDLPLLLGADPRQIAELNALALFGRNTAWFGTLDAATMAAQGVPRFTRTLAGIADRVNARRTLT